MPCREFYLERDLKDSTPVTLAWRPQRIALTIWLSRHVAAPPLLHCAFRTFNRAKHHWLALNDSTCQFAHEFQRSGRWEALRRPGTSGTRTCRYRRIHFLK